MNDNINELPESWKPFVQPQTDPMPERCGRMTTSDQINELATALAKAQGEMSGAVKDSSNPFFRSKYADLASVWDACRAPLSKHGLSVVQFPNTAYAGAPEAYEWTAKQSGETRYGVRVVTTVSVVTRLLHASGQFLEDRVSTMLPTGDPQAVGSAITYLRRYALQAVVGIAPEDDDAEAVHGRGYGVQAPIARGASEATPSAPNGGDSATSNYRTTQYARAAGLPGDALTIQRVDTAPTKNPNVTKAQITLSTGEVVTTIKPQLTALCEAICQEGAPVTIETKATKWGADLLGVRRVETGAPAVVTESELASSDIGFGVA